MTAQKYIETALAQLQEPLELSQPQTENELTEAIFRLLTSKKFRKYALTEAYAAHIRAAIKENVQANKPINLTFLGGCYKLWRLEEAPESDWAELFAHIYFSRWLKPICAIYKPGVWFDFFLDDLIVPRINNLSESDVETYRASRQKIIDFLKPFQPSNLEMTLTGVGSLFKSREEYENSLEQNIKKLSSELPGGLPKLTEAELATTSLNVKATPEQLADPQWREKVELVHSAYTATKASTGYSTISNKIRVFTQPFTSGTCIAVGTTKDSVAKFWVSVGVLQPRDNEFRQIILSPKQLERAVFHWEPLALSGLEGRNFSKIRILE